MRLDDVWLYGDRDNKNRSVQDAKKKKRKEKTNVADKIVLQIAL
jgi:hypothetical protein